MDCCLTVDLTFQQYMPTKASIEEASCTKLESMLIVFFGLRDTLRRYAVFKDTKCMK